MNPPVETIRPSNAIGVAGTNVAIGLFCLALIAGLWAVTIERIDFERREAVRNQFIANSNLAIAYEAHVIGTFDNVGQTLRIIERHYKERGPRTNIRDLISIGEIVDYSLAFIGVTDPLGNVVLGNTAFTPDHAADREGVQFHRQNDNDKMYIGKPLLAQGTGKWTFQVSRRISKADGSFGGIVYAIVDPEYFTSFYLKADLGARGLGMLVGTDGIVRARISGNAISFGRDMHGTKLWEELAKNPAGNFLSSGQGDGVLRYVGYRTLTQYPLIVAVGKLQSDTLASFHTRERVYHAAAAVVSVCIVLFGCGLIFFMAWQRREIKARYSTNARFGAAFNQAAVGMVLSTLDLEILSANAKFCGMLGYSESELLGRTFPDITHPDDLARSNGLRDRIATDRPGGYSAGMEQRYVCKDGSAIWVTIAATLIRDAAGRPDCFMTVIEDIAERKRAELVLADSERRFRPLIEHALDLIVITDREGVITYISPSIKRLTGYEIREALGRNFMAFIHPEDLPAARAAFADIIRDPQQPHTASRRFRHKDGNWIVLESISSNFLDDPLIEGIVVNGREVTKRTQAEQALRRVNRALKAISACNNILIRATNEMTLIQKMCDNIVEVGGYLLAWVGAVEHDAGKTVRPLAYAGYQQGFMEQAQITYADDEHGHGPVGAAIRTQKLQVVKDALRDPAFQPWQANAARLGYGSLVALPLISSGDVIGVLTLYAAGSDAFDESEIQLLNELADDLAFGMGTLRTRAAHAKSEKRLMSSMESTILAMAATMEMRDAYTAGHQRRVAELAVAIAREMDIPEDDVHGLHLAAVIHDLGKIQIPAEILSKPSRLSKLEYELIKTHPQAGYDILKDVEFPWPIAQIVYQHHERLDGSGYPRGLKQADILIGARILAVADTVEAMASHRPYRPGLGIDKALEEIVKKRGTAFDPGTVDACVKLFREKQFAFPI